MSTSKVEIEVPYAQGVEVTKDSLSVDLSDGRTIRVPLAWYPRLLHGTQADRAKWRLIGKGDGIHWPALDEDVSVEGLLAGKPSAESLSSFAKWLSRRKPRKRSRSKS